MSNAILDGAGIGARKGRKMSELIERQRAIELVRDICDAIMSGCGCHYDAEVDDEVFDDILEVDAILKCNKEIRIGLQHLPSVQPEPSQVARDIADIIENEKDMRVIARSEITDEQAILHLQASGWMQRHDKEMYESGLRARLTDDSDSYDALLESVQPEQTRIFVELVVEYPDPELCTYKEYRGKPYYSIKYIENGETHIGFGTYKPEVLSQYLKENFISSAQPDRSCIDQIKWERDTAIQQLNELGYSFGEAIRHDKDAISRKGAINAVCTVLYPDADKMNDAKKVLKEMPSAQPDCADCKKHGGDWECDYNTCHKGKDTIYRQAAYDALMAEPLKWDDSSVWESARCHQWMMDMDAIKALPPAQLGTMAVRGYPIDADYLMAKVAEEYGERARDALYRIIRYMPPAQPEQRWIPVSEQLPEDSSPVLITHRGGVSYGWYNGRYFERGANTNHRKLQTVIAWMPLPEPYREEGE